MVVRLEFCEWVSITKGRNSSHLKRKTFRHIKEFRTVNHHLRSRTNRAEQERPELTRPRAPLKIILPLSLARLCIIWTSNELSRKVCSRIKDRNLAWMVEIRFRSVYNAIVCSQSFQFANHSTKVLTWSRNSVWCAGFMSLAKDKPWNRRKISLIFAHKNGQKLTRAHIRKCLKLGDGSPSPIFLSIHGQPPSKHVRSCLVQGWCSSIIHLSCVSTFEWTARFVQSARICIRLWSKRTSLNTIRHQLTQNKTILRCFSPRPLNGDSNVIFFSQR